MTNGVTREAEGSDGRNTGSSPNVDCHPQQEPGGGRPYAAMRLPRPLASRPDAGVTSSAAAPDKTADAHALRVAISVKCRQPAVLRIFVFLGANHFVTHLTAHKDVVNIRGTT